MGWFDDLMVLVFDMFVLCVFVLWLVLLWWYAVCIVSIMTLCAVHSACVSAVVYRYLLANFVCIGVGNTYR